MLRRLLCVLVFVAALSLQQSFVPTVKACDPTNPNYAYYGTQYGLEITSLNTDKHNYLPGDTVAISGIVTLEAQDVYYSSDCDEFYSGSTYGANPTGVIVSLSTGGQTAVGSDGTFSFNIRIAADASPGSMEFTVTATHTVSGTSDSKTAAIVVESYSPKLSVSISSGYPGDEFTVSGSGWAPSNPVSLDLGGLGGATVVNTDGAGSFTAPAVTIPDDASPGAHAIQARQTLGSLSLSQTATITVQTRLLTVTATASPQPYVKPGDSVTIKGLVEDNDHPVAGATVKINTLALTEFTATTDSSGEFEVTIPVPSSAPPGITEVVVTATKTGYTGDSTTAHFIVIGQLKVTMAFSPDVAMGGDKVTVSGTVTDAFGSPIEGATVELKVQGVAPLDLTTDASGHFSRTGPVSSGLGSYSMTATASKVYYEDASASASMTILPPAIYLVLLLIIILGIMGTAITLRRRSRSRSAGNEASSPDQA